MASKWQKLRGWDVHTKVTDMIPIASKHNNEAKQGVMGMLAGGGISAAFDAAHGDEISASGVAKGAFLGGFGGYMAGHVNDDFMKKLRAKENKIFYKEYHRPLIFGKKKNAAEVAQLKDEVYNKGVKEYFRRAGIVAAAPAVAYHGVDKAKDLLNLTKKPKEDKK